MSCLGAHVRVSGCQTTSSPHCAACNFRRREVARRQRLTTLNEPTSLIRCIPLSRKADFVRETKPQREQDMHKHVNQNRREFIGAAAAALATGVGLAGPAAAQPRPAGVAAATPT